MFFRTATLNRASRDTEESKAGIKYGRFSADVGWKRWSFNRSPDLADEEINVKRTDIPTNYPSSAAATAEGDHRD